MSSPLALFLCCPRVACEHSRFGSTRNPPPWPKALLLQMQWIANTALREALKTTSSTKA